MTSTLVAGLSFLLVCWLVAEGLFWWLRRYWLARLAFDWQWRSFTLLSGHQIKSTLSLGFQLFQWAIRLLVLILALQILGLAHPDTQTLARQAQMWLAERVYRLALSIWGYLPNLLTILFTFWAARAILALNRRLFQAVEAGTLHIPGFDRRWSTPTRQIVGTLTFIMAAATILPIVPGASSPVFRGASVLVGVLISLGSGPAMTNIVSGFLLSYSNAFQVGDVIEVRGQLGQVRERNLLVTRIRNFKNEEITLPNSSIIANKIINFSVAAQEGRLIVATVVTVGYEVDPSLVEATLLKAAQAQEGWILEPAPFVLYHALEGSWIAYELNVHVAKIEDWLSLQSNLRRQVVAQFHAAGIELMTPEIQGLRDANAPRIPPQVSPHPLVPGYFRIQGRGPEGLEGL